MELTDNKPLPHRPPYALSEEEKRALMDMVDEMAEAADPAASRAGELPDIPGEEEDSARTATTVQGGAGRTPTEQPDSATTLRGATPG